MPKALFLQDAVVSFNDFYGCHLKNVSEFERDMIVCRVDCLLLVKEKRREEVCPESHSHFLALSCDLSWHVVQYG